MEIVSKIMLLTFNKSLFCSASTNVMINTYMHPSIAIKRTTLQKPPDSLTSIYKSYQSLLIQSVWKIIPIPLLKLPFFLLSVFYFFHLASPFLLYTPKSTLPFLTNGLLQSHTNYLTSWGNLCPKLALFFSRCSPTNGLLGSTIVLLMQILDQVSSALMTAKEYQANCISGKSVQKSANDKYLL